MSEITLEKIDQIRERTKVTYAKAKEALEASDGDVLNALIYLETNSKNVKDELYSTTEEVVTWIKDMVGKGNINRIRIKKEDKVIIDIPVSAGIGAGVIGSLIYPPLIAIIGIGTLAAVFTEIQIEITKDDGSVEVVNKVIKETASNIKDKMQDIATGVKDKFTSKKQESGTTSSSEDNVYQYTVKFNDIDNGNEDK